MSEIFEDQKAMGRPSKDLERKARSRLGPILLSSDLELDRLVFERQAQVAKALAHPKRIEIVHLLHAASAPVPASELLEKTGISKTNLSQQMSVLISVGLVESSREGSGSERSRLRYRLTSPKIGNACETLREALFERMEMEGDLARRRRERGDV